MAQTVDPSALEFRAATEEDSDSVFTLLQCAFRSHILPYTIYQSPASKTYLHRLIASQDTLRPRIVVATSGSRILAFYEAVCNAGDFFLNYIAVDDAARGVGLGSRVLSHFEREAVMRSCETVSLDVFRSNTRAWSWYLARGYGERSHQHLCTVAIDRLTHEGVKPLTYDQASYDRALAQVDQQGFSKVEAAAGTGSVVLGLIASDCCKLLEHRGVALADAVRCVSAAFGHVRPRLLVNSTEPLHDSLPKSSSEIVVRLTKTLGAES